MAPTTVPLVDRFRVVDVRRGGLLRLQEVLDSREHHVADGAQRAIVVLLREVEVLAQAVSTTHRLSFLRRTETDSSARGST